MESILILIVFIAIIFTFIDELGIIVSNPLTNYYNVVVIFERKGNITESPYKYEIMICSNYVVYIWFSEGFLELCVAIFGIVVQLLIDEFKQK